jgi:argininosuccinate synthase
LEKSKEAKMAREGIKKIILAYSGGLDTSVMLKWLGENYHCEVVAFLANLGQEENLARLERKAYQIGASRVYVEDLREEFAVEYIFPTLRAEAHYEQRYLLGTALSRPLIAKKLVEIAQREKADAVAHGCTGKGNDQVRFEVTIRALDPKLKIIAPAREWELASREEEIEYAQKHKIPIPVTKRSPYSIDKNLWHTSIESGPLEDITRPPGEDCYQETISPQKAPARAEEVEIEFKQGTPVKVNGRELPPVKLIRKLALLGSKHGIGRVDMIENRLVGIKSREVYETPAASLLYLAHWELETLTLDRETLHFKNLISQKYGELVYYGLWFSPLKEALDGFVTKTQERVSGKIRLKLYKGTTTCISRVSPYSLYEPKLATYGKEDIFDHTLAKGFIELWGLPLKLIGVKKLSQKSEK